MHFKSTRVTIGNSLAVQWLGLHAFTAKGTVSISGLRGYKSQWSQKRKKNLILISCISLKIPVTGRMLNILHWLQSTLLPGYRGFWGLTVIIILYKGLEHLLLFDVQRELVPEAVFCRNQETTDSHLNFTVVWVRWCPSWSLETQSLTFLSLKWLAPSKDHIVCILYYMYIYICNVTY